MKIKLCIAAVLLLCAYSGLQGQTIIKGTITDAQTLTPLNGATVTLKTSGKTTAANENGKFSIDIPDSGDSLIVSNIGYYTRKLFVLKNNVNIIIKLSQNVNEIASITVNTGYQNLPKERATGSFYKINGRLLSERVSTDIISKLNGITSGLVFNKDADGNTQLRIRGQSTIFANAEPLIIVDNFPYSGDINNINPNDVESITILKDAAAASIWGVRAGNGVIVITTKKGSYNQSLKVELNLSITSGSKSNIFYDPNFLNAKDFIQVEKTLFNQGYYNAEESSNYKPPFSPVVELLVKERDGTISASEANAQIDAFQNYDVRNDLLKYFYRAPLSQQHNINLSGGSNTFNYLFSAGFDENLSSQQGNKYSRISLNTYSTYNPIKNLEFSIGMNYIRNNTRTDNALGEINTGGLDGKTIYPYAQLADEAGTPLPIVKDYRTGYIATAEQNGFLNWQFYPLNEKGLWVNDETGYDTRITAAVNYAIIRPLNIEVKYQYEEYATDGKNLAKEGSYYARNLINHYSYTSADGTVAQRNIPDGSILDKLNNNLNDQSVRAQLNFNNSWLKNSVTAIAGIEARPQKTANYSNRLFGYDEEIDTYQNVDAITFFFPLSPFGFGAMPLYQNVAHTINRFRSYFGNAAYTYNNRYTLSASGRIDQSNFFGVNANQRSVPLWSAGFKWDADKEDFYHAEWLPSLKLRLTYGYNGNLDKTVTAFTTAYYLSNAYYTNANWAIIQSTPNPDLQWEKTGMLNLGVDFALKNNIVTGSIDLYQKRGVDLMGDEVLAPSSGFAGPQNNYNFRGNFAALKGKGVDVMLNFKPLDKIVKWDIGLLFSYAADKVTKYDLQIPAFYYLGADGKGGSIYPYVGRPVYGVYSYKWGGLDSETGDPTGYLDGKESKDYSALSNDVDFEDFVYNGPAKPVFFGGLNSTISWKRLSLFFSLSYKLDYFFKRTSINYSNLFNAWVSNKDFELRWQEPGDEKITNVPSMPTTADFARDNFYLNSETLVAKGDNVRLQDINLSYQIQNNANNHLPFKNIRLFIYANNICILWKANKEGLDPDYPTGGFPSSRTVSFGLKATF